MKRIFSFLLAVMLLVSALPVAYAADTQDYSLGTAVVYTADEEANENWTVTVPASLAPGKGGTVTLEGYWPSTKVITVTAQESVKLTNSINANDTKTLAIDFKNGISAAGSNTEKQKFTETVSVEAIANALFGTWDGHFYYTVGTQNAPVLEGDGQVFFTALPETLSFRSTAPMSEFQEVQVNGETVDPSNYTVTEGSTIITLHEDYLMTLGAEAHQITVVSDSGSPSAGFSVRDTITYEEGDYVYTIMQDGFETLEDARTYYKVWAENQYGIIWDEWVVTIGSEEDCWRVLTYEANAYPLTEDTFLASTSCNKYWSVSVVDKTKTTYGTMRATLNGYAVTDMTACFYECYYLTDAIFPEGITNIGINAFCMSGLESVVIPEGVTSIGNSAFMYCQMLTNVIIPDSVTSIGMHSFSYIYDSLTSISIPSSVTSIGKEAFHDCTGLSNITFEGTIEQWNAISFGMDWNSNVPATEVICSDGTVALS